ncbi:MAG: ABC transporter permease [Acidimicrobiia bacterium]
MIIGKLTLRSLRARWIRFGLTSLAVIAGVGAVTASFVLSDTLRKTFDTIATSATSNLDVLVRSVDALGGDDAASASRAPIPQSLLDELAAVDGVAVAEGNVQFLASITAPDGEAITTAGAPIFGFGWVDRPDGAFEITEGRGPTAPGEIAIDQAAADTYDIAIGDTVTVRAVGNGGEFTVVGFDSFGEGAGSLFMLFEMSAAQELANIPGQYQAVSLTATDDVNEVELRDRVAQLLPEGYEAITGSEFSQEFSESFGQIIDIIRTVLLVFAFVILFVAGFIINVVFNTTLGQRVRELGLLRAIGARNGQITRSVLAESLGIGLLASVIGTGMGIVFAALLKLLITSQGGGFPDTPLVLSGGTWIVAFVVGMGVTTLVSLVPAWRAGRVPPVTAMRDGGSLVSDSIKARTITGAVLAAIGLIAFLYALFGSFDGTAPRLTIMGTGALLLFLGATAISPVVAKPVATALSAPFVAVYGVTGRLAQGNAARNPRRTATTASALMVGVALVAMVGVLGASFKATFSEQLSTGISADYFVQARNFVGFTPELARQLDELPETEQVTTFRQGQVRIDGDTKSVQAVQATGLDEVVNLDVLSGTSAEIPADGILVQEQAAEDLGLTVGSPVSVTFPLGERELEVTGVFGTAVTNANWIISQDLFEEAFPPDVQLDVFGGFTLADGVDRAQGEAAVTRITDEYPDVELQDRAEFQKQQEDQIDQTTIIIYALLLIALVIAVLGIFITLMLAVYERTRELGLLRAVGQQRRQTRRMIRAESIVVSLFGAVLGVVLGLVFGVAIAAALPASVMSVITIPYGQLVIILVLAAIAGVVAGFIPAFQASKLNVLDAISYE